MCLREIKTPDGIGVPVSASRSVKPVFHVGETFPGGIATAGAPVITCNVPGHGEVAYDVETLRSLNPEVDASNDNTVKELQ